MQADPSWCNSNNTHFFCNKERNYIYKYLTGYIWHVTRDMWHLTHYTWPLTPDMWLWWWMNILSKIQLSSSSGLGVVMFWRFGGKELLSKSMNEWQRCLTPCLLNIDDCVLMAVVPISLGIQLRALAFQHLTILNTVKFHCIFRFPFKLLYFRFKRSPAGHQD